MKPFHMKNKIIFFCVSVVFFIFFVQGVTFAEGKKVPGSVDQDTYVIGCGDTLSIQVWREPNLSGNFTVRPDGKITFPLLNDIKADGLSPLQLKKVIEKGLTKYIATPVVTVVVSSANSKNIFVLGKVNSPGKYPLTGPTTVLQALAEAGGLAEWAKGDDIVILRNKNGKQVKIEFDYDDVSRGKHLEQNIFLKPGDTIVVP